MQSIRPLKLPPKVFIFGTPKEAQVSLAFELGSLHEDHAVTSLLNPLGFCMNALFTGSLDIPMDPRSDFPIANTHVANMRELILALDPKLEALLGPEYLARIFMLHHSYGATEEATIFVDCDPRKVGPIIDYFGKEECLFLKLGISAHPQAPEGFRCIQLAHDDAAQNILQLRRELGEVE